MSSDRYLIWDLALLASTPLMYDTIVLDDMSALLYFAPPMTPFPASGPAFAVKDGATKASHCWKESSRYPSCHVVPITSERN